MLNCYNLQSMKTCFTIFLISFIFPSAFAYDKKFVDTTATVVIATNPAAAQTQIKNKAQNIGVVQSVTYTKLPNGQCIAVAQVARRDSYFNK